MCERFLCAINAPSIPPTTCIPDTFPRPFLQHVLPLTTPATITDNNRPHEVPSSMQLRGFASDPLQHIRRVLRAIEASWWYVQLTSLWTHKMWNKTLPCWVGWLLQLHYTWVTNAKCLPRLGFYFNAIVWVRRRKEQDHLQIIVLLDTRSVY